MRKRIVTSTLALFITILGVLMSNPEPGQAAATVRSVLSVSGKASYDAAAAGSYFVVSKTDYDSAFNNLAGVTKIGTNDTDTAACQGTWTAQFVTVKDSTINLPANKYILGFASGFLNPAPANTSIRLVASSTFKGTYDWLVSTYAPVSGNGAKYFLFKEPATYSSTKYLGHWSSENPCTSGNHPNGAYAGPSATPTWSSFSNTNGALPNLQVMYTSTDQWTPAPPTISASLAGNAKSVFKGIPISISTSLSDDGLVTFKYNNKNIGGCISVRSASLSATCSWKPSVQGSGRITATLRSPTASFTSVTSPALYVSVIKRGNNR